MSSLEKNTLLTSLRERCNLTQTGLATRAGISLPTVNRAELGHPISPASRERLCAFFSERLNRAVGPEELGLLKNPLPESGPHPSEEPLPPTIILLADYRTRRAMQGGIHNR